MSMFGRQSRDHQGLEDELRQDRPQADDRFVDELLTKISATPMPYARPRLGLALAFVLVTIVVFGAFGGLGYAMSAASDAVSSTTNAVSAVVNVDKGTVDAKAENGDDNASKAGQAQYHEEVLICHRPPGSPDNSQTLSVQQSAVAAHLAHGDTLGPCENDKPGNKK